MIIKRKEELRSVAPAFGGVLEMVVGHAGFPGEGAAASPGDELDPSIREESQFSHSKDLVQEDGIYSNEGSEALESRMYGQKARKFKQGREVYEVSAMLRDGQRWVIHEGCCQLPQTTQTRPSEQEATFPTTLVTSAVEGTPIVLQDQLARESFKVRGELEVCKGVVPSPGLLRIRAGVTEHSQVGE